MSTIEEILELSGPLPCEAAHRRWLESLPSPRLAERLEQLRVEAEMEREAKRSGGQDVTNLRMRWPAAFASRLVRAQQTTTKLCN